MTTTSSTIDLINSQIDVTSIVQNLIYADSAPVRRMQNQVTSLQSKISAFQTLNTRLSTLTDKVETILYGTTNAPLTSPFSFTERIKDSVFSKCSVTSSDETSISAIADSAYSGGTYSIAVTDLAQTRSMVSSNFADALSTNTGSGSIIIKTGDNDAVTITINDNNNNLTGVCNAINAANAGVTASIFNDGTSTPYRLLVTADESGTANSFELTDSLTGGQSLGLEEKQAAVDSKFTLNGISITKSSNTINDVIPGVTFTLKDQTTGAVKLTVEKDFDAIVSSLTDFVSAYNNVNSYINSQFAYDSTNKTSGTLSGDSSLRTIQSNLQSQIVKAISNRYSKYSVSGEVGLEFNRDGSLSLDATKLRSALASDFNSVAALFLGDGTPPDSASASDSRVTYNSKTTATQAKDYSIDITSLAQKASAVGNQVITQLSDNEILTITAGSLSATAELSLGDNIASVLQKINSALSTGGLAIKASNDGSNKVKLTATDYGSALSFIVQSDKSDASGFTGFGTIPVSAIGIDIAGTIDGHTATGSGLNLTGATGQPEEGLNFRVSQTATGNYGTITVASADKGVEGASIFMNMHSLLSGMTDPLAGPIHNSTDAMNQNIKALNDEISNYQIRLNIEKDMLTQQFNQADQALKLLQVTQSSISGQLSKLAS
jgi:flagellar hook-associated protein 2